MVGVSDGDTVKAGCGEPGAYEEVEVRLNGIDAPKRAQRFGQRAKQALSDIVYGKPARLECAKTDRYGCSVCAVMVAPASTPNDPQTLDAGLAMVTVGMAWWYRAYAREQSPQNRGQYEFAEAKRERNALGSGATTNRSHRGSGARHGEVEIHPQSARPDRTQNTL